MIAFQVLGIALLAAFAVLTIAAARRHHVTWPGAIAWVALWIAAALAIAFPDSTMVVAHVVGIQRGADLVLYCSILAMFAGFFAVFVRLRRIEHDLTRIVREIAIRDARARGQDPADGPPEA